MCKIVSDSSALYNKEQAAAKGVTTCPLRVTVSGKSYLDLDEISSAALVQKINQGEIPYTSQPPIGEKIEAYDSSKESVLDICMADGLSGTYQTAAVASKICSHPEKVTIFNSRTLCGPHQAMVEKALEMNEQKKSIPEIVGRLEQAAATDISFLIPMDFDFLKRGGRVRGMEAGLGSLLKLVPIMQKSEDGTCLRKAAIARTVKKAVEYIASVFEKSGVDESYRIYISHAFNAQAAQKARQLLKTHFPNTQIITLPLSPAFIAQGGPGCMAIQTIQI